MGTMFDIVVYHASREEAERAIEKAMDEIVRLDQVMSDFEADSDLSRLVREGRRGVVPVDPSLYEVIQESLMFSRRSGGKFDVTIAPLLKTWKRARRGRPQPVRGGDRGRAAVRRLREDRDARSRSDTPAARTASRSTSAASEKGTPWTARSAS